MEKNNTKPVKKKLELKKTTIAKFVMNEKHLKMVNGGGETGQSGDTLCTATVAE